MDKEYYRGEEFWTAHKLWDSPPITDQLIKKAEARLGITLPASYIELLKEQNGGAINFPYFDLGDEELVIDHLYGIDLDDAKLGIGMLASAAIIKKRKIPVPPSKVIIIWSDYYRFIGLDYRHTKENPPVIYLWEHDEEENEWGGRRLARSFKEFLANLYRKPGRPKKIRTVYKQQISFRNFYI